MCQSYGIVGSHGSSDFGFLRYQHTHQMTALAKALTNSAEGFAFLNIFATFAAVY